VEWAAWTSKLVPGAAQHTQIRLRNLRILDCVCGALQKIEAGEKLFAKGDTADAMYVIGSGRFVLPESGIELTAGAIVGELGLLAPAGLRTQSLVCEGDGAVLRLGYEQFKQLYFQNPKFGYYFLRLTTERLFENLATLEQTLAVHGIPNPLAAGRAVTTN